MILAQAVTAWLKLMRSGSSVNLHQWVKGEGKVKYVALVLNLFCRNFTEVKPYLHTLRENSVWQKCLVVLHCFL